MPAITVPPQVFAIAAEAATRIWAGSRSTKVMSVMPFVAIELVIVKVIGVVFDILCQFPDYTIPIVYIELCFISLIGSV
jgi:hypothetical protein